MKKITLSIVLSIALASCFGQIKSSKQPLALNNKMFRGQTFIPYFKLNPCVFWPQDNERFDAAYGVNAGYIGSFDAPHARPNYNFELYLQFIKPFQSDTLFNNLISFRLANNIDIKLSKKQKRTYPIMRLGLDGGVSALENSKWIRNDLDITFGGIIGGGIHIFPKSIIDPKSKYDSTSRLEYKALLIYSLYSNPHTHRYTASNAIALHIIVKNLLKDHYWHP